MYWSAVTYSYITKYTMSVYIYAHARGLNVGVELHELKASKLIVVLTVSYSSIG